MNESKLAEIMHSFIHSLIHRLTFVLKTYLAEVWILRPTMKGDIYGFGA
jgi:hypothetical protein